MYKNKVWGLIVKDSLNSLKFGWKIWTVKMGDILHKESVRPVSALRTAVGFTVKKQVLVAPILKLHENLE